MNTSSSTNNNTSMDFAMAELAKLHLMVADQVLMKGNTTAAFNQLNLAYLQLSMLGMKDMVLMIIAMVMIFALEGQ